jgi:hypothetical protein
MSPAGWNRPVFLDESMFPMPSPVNASTASFWLSSTWPSFTSPVVIVTSSTTPL